MYGMSNRIPSVPLPEADVTSAAPVSLVASDTESFPVPPESVTDVDAVVLVAAVADALAVADPLVPAELASAPPKASALPVPDDEQASKLVSERPKPRAHMRQDAAFPGFVILRGEGVCICLRHRFVLASERC